MFSDKWDKRFLEVAKVIRQWSKDQSTQVGSVIVTPDRHIVATGYNGLPPGVDDDKKTRQERPQKYFYFTHAEVNAIFQVVRRPGNGLLGCCLYSTLFPCADCARAIITSGITRVVVLEEEIPVRLYEALRQSWEAAADMFEEANVSVDLVRLS